MSQTIKLIALDLDGTLLYQHREIRPRNIAAVQKARQRGLEVVIATGRMHRSACRFAQQLGLNIPIISYQGALVRTLDGQTLRDTPIAQMLARALLAFAEGRGLTAQAYVDDRLCVSYINEQTADYALTCQVPLMSCADLTTWLPGPAHKILCIGSPEQCDAAWQKGQELFGEQLYITKSQPQYLEFMNKQAGKGHALQYLCGKMGINKEEVMAVGDNLNDRELFTAAGLKVAMGDGMPQLIELADYVTAPCAEDGVAQAIEKYVL